MTIQDRVGAEIKTWRKALGWSQQDVGDLFGWNRDAVSKVETGKNNISLHDYLVIVRSLAEGIPRRHPAVALMTRLDA
jgi:transcriptional regulator with XRE-family HTH domain